MEGNYKKWLNRINSKQDRLQDVTGNVGVGKTDASATEKLDVNGNVKANKFLPNYTTYDSSFTKVEAINPTTNDRTLVDLPIGGGSSGGLIEVTYAELVNLKNTSSLVKGQNYLLTDYMTTYEQPVTGISKSSDVIEPLIITATDIDKLHNVCKSTLYPQDIVYYEITGDIGNYYGTEGFTKGKIYRRIDTLRNNDIGTDWRHVKYDRDGVDKLLFEDYNDCYNNVIKTYNLFNSVVGNYFAGNTIGYNFYGNTIGDNFSINTIGNDVYGNTIGDNFYSNTIGNGFISNTIGNDVHGNTIGDNFSINTIGNYVYGNTIGNDVYGNTIGNDVYGNTIGNDVYGNTIGDNFSSNTIGNGFISNTIGNAVDGNTIGNDVYGNTIGDNFYSNTIGDSFRDSGNPTIPFLSKNTEFRSDIAGLNSTTEIQNENIDVVVFKSPNGTKKQRYYDDSNNLVINNL